MSSNVAVSAESLGKRYRIGAAVVRQNTLRDALAHRVRALRDGLRASGRNARSGHRDIWALKDVSFDVPRGEVLGIVGRNGAGKSTLLKILSRITEPTEGRARIRGRVASLLEVGVGFHPELTGRENIFVNGAILGMSRRDIASRFDEIVAFSEVEQFIDTPVKHYSSGMHVRLAFAVAAHLEPDVLLVDEVLAVGDAGFQKKCLGKMRDVGQVGRTVLFVSHNLAAVAGLCHRAMLVDGGRIVHRGDVARVVEAYLGSFGDPTSFSLASRTDRYGDGRLRVTSVGVLDADGQPASGLQSGRPGSIVLRYECPQPERIRNVLVNVYLFTAAGERLCDFATDLVGDNFAQVPAAGEFVCRVPLVPLQPGRYPFTFRVYSSERLMLDNVEYAGHITVDAGDFHGNGRTPEPGAVFVDHSWNCRSLTAAPDLSLTAL